jgi:hypothetical protein
MMLAFALAGPGCLNLPPLGHDTKPAPAEIVETPAPPPPPPAVLPDQVNESNALQKAKELREELDYAATHLPAPTVMPVPAEKAKP